MIHDWVLETARRRGDRPAVRQLEALAPPGDGPASLHDLSTRLRWVNRFGGGVMRRPGAFRELAWVMARSRVYTTWEKLRYFKGEAFSLEHLYAELAEADLFAEVPSLEVPVYFVHGRHDRQVPIEVARDYFTVLRAPHKEFAVFEASAHSPLFEEPERFHQLMRRVLAETRDTPGPTGVCRSEPASPAGVDRPLDARHCAGARR